MMRVSERVQQCLLLGALAVLWCPATAAAQVRGTVRGIVVSDTDTPIPGAHVAVTGLSRTALTDSTGRFTLADLPAASHRISASAGGYRTETQVVAVTAGDAISIRFRLTHAAVALEPLTVVAERAPEPTAWLPQISGTVVVGAKKSETINLGVTAANLAENNPRQVFARIPGITVWELDGNGLQTNISARGLNPHRSWEFLVAQNGVHVNSDLYGYPEAHYNPPLEAVERIEIVRGTGALEFGPQFGGRVNYVLKRGDPTRTFAYESHVSSGTDGLLGTYNAVGGQWGRLNHYSYVQLQRRDGWRHDSGYDSYAIHTGLDFEVSPALRLGVEYSRMYYVVQFAGGLTDAQFAANPQQSRRERNYFNPNMNIPAASLSWQASDRTLLDVRAWSIIGQRNSVQFIADPTVSDTVNHALGTFNPRVVDRDYYNGVVLEARSRTTYQAFGNEQVVTSGVKLFDEGTHRRQRGRGTTGSDFDLSLISPTYPTDLNYHTRSAAPFLEQALTLTPRLLLTAGARYEIINTHFHGTIDTTTYRDAATRKQRNVPLFGAGATYQIASNFSAYGGWSQAFRPVLYSDLIPSGSIAVVDSTLRDARGSNAELGVRGSGRAYRFDVTAFQLSYPNRVGTVGVGEGTASAYVRKTNVGASVAQGVESFVSVHPLQLGKQSEYSDASDLELFSAIAYDHARYTDGSLATGTGSKIADVSLDGKRVEGAPDWIVRSGLSASRNGLSATLQHSFVSKTFADALNSSVSVNGVTGPVPAYTIVDLSLGYTYSRLSGRAGINNLGDARYFTRRTNQYPGPGIIPSDGRTLFVTLVLRSQ